MKKEEEGEGKRKGIVLIMVYQDIIRSHHSMENMCEQRAISVITGNIFTFSIARKWFSEVFPYFTLAKAH